MVWIQLLLSFATAKTVTIPYSVDPATRWIATASTKNILVLERFVKFPKATLPVSSISMSVHPHKVMSRENAYAEAFSIAKVFQDAAHAQDWQIEKNGDSILFRSDWKKHNRQVEMIYKNLGSRYAFSMAVTRRAFALPVVAEAHVIMEQFQQRAQIKVSALEQMGEWFFGQRAEAALTGALNTPYGNFGGSVSIDQATLTRLDNSLTGLEQNLLNPVVNGANNVVGNAGRVAGQTIDRVSAAGNGLINNATGAFNNGINGARGLISQGEQSADRVIDHAQAAVEKASSFQNLFTAAFAAGAGGAAGVAAAQLVIDGSGQLVHSLYYNLIGKLDPDERDKMKADANKGFADLQKSAEDLTLAEMRADAQLAAIETGGGDLATNSGENLTYNLGMAKKLNDAFNEKFKIPTTNETCNANSYYLDQRGQLLDTMIKIVKGKSRSVVCEQAEDSLNQWTSAALRLNLARQKVAANAGEMAVQIKTNLIDAYNPVGNQRKRDNECFRNDPQVEQMIGPLIEDCLKKGNSREYCDSQYTQGDTFKQVCNDINKMNRERPMAAMQTNALALSGQEARNLRDLVQKLAVADCPPGDTSGTCAKFAPEGGEFFRAKARYNKLVERGLRDCPNFRPIPFPADAPAPQIAATSTTNEELSEKQSPSFWSSPIRFVTNWWDRQFS